MTSYERRLPKLNKTNGLHIKYDRGAFVMPDVIPHHVFDAKSAA